MWIECAVLLIFLLFGIAFLIWDYGNTGDAPAKTEELPRSSLDKFI